MNENGELLNDNKASRKNLLGIGPVIYSVVDGVCRSYIIFSLTQMSNIIIIHSIGYCYRVILLCIKAN